MRNKRREVKIAHLSHFFPLSGLEMHRALALAQVLHAFGPFSVDCILVFDSEVEYGTK